MPPQAVVTGPEGRFVYVVQPDSKVARVPVQVVTTTAAAAVVEGVQPGARVVVEGTQNLRPGALVREAPAAGASAAAPRPANGATGH
ncbi:multidrug efflux system subunit MdtA [compost metagenome]